MIKEEKLKEQIIFDSISDEEQDKVAKKLNRIFKIEITPKQ